MGKMIRLKAKDGHELDAYLAEPKGEAKGGIVVVQEIFGVTNHIKRVADQYAAQGYKAVAPAMFDRIKRNITLRVLGDSARHRVHAAAASGRTRSPISKPRRTRCALRAARRSSAICWGGTVAHVAASELDLDAAVSYYGGGVAKMLDKKPRARSCITSAIRTRRFRCPTSRRSRRPIPRARCSSTAAPATASIATSARSYSAMDAKVAFDRSIEFLEEQA